MHPAGTRFLEAVWSCTSPEAIPSRSPAHISSWAKRSLSTPQRRWSPAHIVRGGRVSDNGDTRVGLFDCVGLMSHHGLQSNCVRAHSAWLCAHSVWTCTLTVASVSELGVERVLPQRRGWQALLLGSEVMQLVSTFLQCCS